MGKDVDLQALAKSDGAEGVQQAEVDGRGRQAVDAHLLDLLLKIDEHASLLEEELHDLLEAVGEGQRPDASQNDLGCQHQRELEGAGLGHDRVVGLQAVDSHGAAASKQFDELEGRRQELRDHLGDRMEAGDEGLVVHAATEVGLVNDRACVVVGRCVSAVVEAACANHDFGVRGCEAVRCEEGSGAVGFVHRTQHAERNVNNLVGTGCELGGALVGNAKGAEGIGFELAPDVGDLRGTHNTFKDGTLECSRLGGREGATADEAVGVFHLLAENA